MTNKTKCLSAAALAMTVVSAHGAKQADPYLWLEDVESKDALEWVKKHNGQTDAYLEKKSQYDAFYNDSLAVLNAQDRLAYPTRRGTFYYNFWQDDTHVKGIYRRTSAQSYAQKAPEWETVIDIDALAQKEQKDWVLKGVDCYAPDYQRCMVALSLGGADATVKREFDMLDKAFVHDGFTLPEAKSGTTWLDRDNLLVATDFGPDSLTDSGYPRTIKQWQRGTPLSEATTLYQGATDSVSVSAMTLRDSHSRVTLIAEGMTFYSQKLFWLNADDLVPLALPADSEVMGYFEGQLFFQLKSDYRQGERTFPQGSIVYASMTELAKPTPDYQLLVKPTASASIEALDVTAEYLVVSWLNDVTSQIQLFRPQDTGQWHTQTVAIEDNATLSVFNATPEHHDFLST
jgi:Serine proteases of the peptidase family S9A